MGARNTSLNLVAFSVNPHAGGNLSYLCNLTDIRVKTSNELVDGRCITESFEYMQLAKKGMTFSATMNQSATANTKPMQTNLDASVYSIGGTSYLGDLTSFSMSLTNNSKEGSGLADVYQYGNVTGRVLTISGAHLIASGVVLQPLIDIIVDGNAAAQAVTTVFTGGLADFSLPTILESIEWSSSRDGLQEYNVGLKPRGAPTTPSGTTSIIGCAFNGADVTMYLDTGSGQFGASGSRLSAIITGFQLEVKDRAIITHQVEFMVQGTPSFVTS